MNVRIKWVGVREYDICTPSDSLAQFKEFDDLAHKQLYQVCDIDKSALTLSEETMVKLRQV